MKWAKYWNRILRYIISVIILSGPENIEAWAGSIACIIIISWKILCERACTHLVHSCEHSKPYISS